MPIVCPKCNRPIPNSVGKCISCGMTATDAQQIIDQQQRQQQQPIINQGPPNQTPPTSPSNTKSAGLGEGLFGGCVGVSCGIWFIIIGIVLCFTGVGALIGIPLIIAGLLAPFLGGVIGLAQLKGNCPYCAMTITADATSIGNGGIDCPSCTNRILIRDKQFLKAEDVIK